jgi:acetyl-CoA carboxylase biotin carboxyl carrier protein
MRESCAMSDTPKGAGGSLGDSGGEIEELLKVFAERADLSLLDVETEGFRLTLRRGGADGIGVGTSESRRSSNHPNSAGSTDRAVREVSGPTSPGEVREIPDQAEPHAGDGGGEGDDDGLSVVRAPMAGIIYEAPSPGAPPYVQVGDKVEPDTTLALIEAMKVFTAVPADVGGVVVSTMFTNGQFVEFDQPLLKIRGSEALK